MELVIAFDSAASKAKFIIYKINEKEKQETKNPAREREIHFES